MKNETIINPLQKTIDATNKLYMGFIALLIVIFIVTLGLYINNPSSFTTKLGGTIFLTLFAGIVIFSLLRFYNNISDIGKDTYYNLGNIALGGITSIGLFAGILGLLGAFSSGAGITLLIIFTLVVAFALYPVKLSDTMTSSELNYKHIYIALGTTVVIGIFAGILGYLGAFSSVFPDDSSSLLLNYFVLFSFILLFLFSFIKINEMTNIKRAFTLPPLLKQFEDDRLKYTIGLFLYIAAIVILYIWNPWNIMTTYGGPTIFLLLFISVILIGMIAIFNFYFNNPDKLATYRDSPSLTMMFQSIYVLVGVFFSGLILYWFLHVLGTFNQDSTTANDVGRVILNSILLVGALAIIYKIANTGGFLERNPIFRFIVNTLFYIPCLLVGLVDTLNTMFTGLDKPGSKTSKGDLFFLIMTITIISLYLLFKFIIIPMVTQYYYTQGGKQLINQPLPINELTNVATYQQLNDTDKFNYQYAMSFWVYIDALPPNTNSSYLKLTPILSYGENPCVKYEANTNTLTITVKQDIDANVNTDIKTSEPNKDLTPEEIETWNTLQKKSNDIKTTPIASELDKDGHRIIYKNTDWLLQKWNNIILNYNGGTLDVFINGELLKSAIEVVPYMKYDMLVVGADNGVTGNIANLMYFKKPLDVMSIYFLYNSFKDKIPPSLDTNDKQLVNISPK